MNLHEVPKNYPPRRCHGAPISNEASLEIFCMGSKKRVPEGSDAPPTPWLLNLRVEACVTTEVFVSGMTFVNTGETWRS